MPAAASETLSDPALGRLASDMDLLSDATRCRVVASLVRGTPSVGELAKSLGLTQPALSHHLALLRVAGVVAVERQGKSNFYSLDPAWSASLLSRLETLFAA